MRSPGKAVKHCDTGNIWYHPVYNIHSREYNKEAALPEDLLRVDQSALEKVISGYTKEAGVRGLERQLAIICRKAALKYLEENCEQIEVTPDNLSDYLGRERFRKEEIAAKGEPGIVRGLAWTSVGGVTLEVEVNVTPGKGQMKLTGKLGDVMKESAQAALSCVPVSYTHLTLPTT